MHLRADPFSSGIYLLYQSTVGAVWSSFILHLPLAAALLSVDCCPKTTHAGHVTGALC